MHGGGGVSITNIWVAGAILFGCILFSALFSGSETAMTAASRARMHALEKLGDPRAATVNRLLAGRDRLIGAMLLGNTLFNIGSSALLTTVLVAMVGERGAIYATAVMTVLLLVFAEVLPKTVAINYPDQVSLIVARVVSFFVTIFGPVLFAVERLVRGALYLCGLRLDEKTPLLSPEEELKSAVDLMHREGGVARTDRDMFGGLLDLKELTVSDAMVHRTKMVALDADTPIADIVREVVASPYTRVPMWRGSADNIIGVLHAKDLLRALSDANGDVSKIDLEPISHEPWFVPDTTSLEAQLQAFRKRKTHFALVVDEYGDVQGLVTLEDILEEIVGDIRDEHDVAFVGVRRQADGSVIVDGSAPVRDLNRVMDWDLPDEEATTIAGLVIHEARAIPEAGQKFAFHGFHFEVLRKQRNRITLLRLTPEPKTKA
ncbi:HlyC/CorC family transporter [Rhodoblastus acidophilus]|uniref:HlyC/CorC family transporter n=1 Tax=Candidatus Rhodoblastus alkanivorans TaxID=2954117 RepID=A0ABS9Z135_9HYPH|nr:HlyC/CorC family transporter [Candidatus Rhodoblastus alkanivorans]MCI4678542.1 HlyC/CorC family transporter [Candidatus Rhodoblastus alkanivorans]MCI4681370.1 HlyC/CorC family transporter [Candidatus Rhodoblastus alkanivorans]MDI4642418.1 HlyC/CorC family transporter [Rhodoblastus acidophilus]